jgi:dTDP-4-dehydrorhamnose 3,5-epimerase
MKFTYENTVFEDLKTLSPKVLGDQRGFFFESYNQQEFSSIGISDFFVQDNHSKSSKGVLRGFHIQSQHAQAKLIRVISGAVFDVVVDLRSNSSTFGQSFSIILSAENKKMLFVPKGFAHGFLSLSDSVEFLYKTSDYYYPEFETGILWNDSDLNISWPFEEYNIEKPILSDKDKKLLSFSNFNQKYTF